MFLVFANMSTSNFRKYNAPLLLGMIWSNSTSVLVKSNNHDNLVFSVWFQVIALFLLISVQLLVHVSLIFHDVRDKLPLVLLFTHLGHCSTPSVSGVHAATLAYDLPETWLPIFLSSSIQSEGSDHQTHHPYQLPHQTIRHSCCAMFCASLFRCCVLAAWERGGRPEGSSVHRVLGFCSPFSFSFSCPLLSRLCVSPAHLTQAKERVYSC